MQELQNDSDYSYSNYSFEYASANSAIASVKYKLERSKSGKEKLYMHNALKCLYAAREWISRAEDISAHE